MRLGAEGGAVGCGEGLEGGATQGLLARALGRHRSIDRADLIKTRLCLCAFSVARSGLQKCTWIRQPTPTLNNLIEAHLFALDHLSDHVRSDRSMHGQEWENTRAHTVTSRAGG